MSKNLDDLQTKIPIRRPSLPPDTKRNFKIASVIFKFYSILLFITWSMCKKSNLTAWPWCRHAQSGSRFCQKAICQRRKYPLHVPRPNNPTWGSIRPFQFFGQNYISRLNFKGKWVPVICQVKFCKQNSGPWKRNYTIKNHHRFC